MECEQAEELLACIFEVDCAGTSVQELVVHLHACVDCRELMANLLMLKAMMRIARDQRGLLNPRLIHTRTKKRNRLYAYCASFFYRTGSYKVQGARD